MPASLRQLDIFPITTRRLEVLRVTDVSPGMRRVTLGGPALRAHVAENGYPVAAFRSDGFDDEFKLFMRHPDVVEAVGPTQADGVLNWPRDPHLLTRTYTVRRWDAERGEVDVEVVRHGVGPATTWVSRVQPGDQIQIAGPKMSAGHPRDADWVLIAGDETALPAIGRWLAEWPSGARAQVFIEVAEPSHQVALPVPEGVRLTWLSRDGRPAGSTTLLYDAITTADWWAGTVFAWVAGESLTLTPIRRWLRGEKGLAKEQVEVTGYWRVQPGTAEANAGPEQPSDEIVEGDEERFHELRELAPGFAVRVAATIGLGGALAGRPRTLAGLAADIGADRTGLRKLLRYLAALGLVTRDGERYALTSLGRELEDDDTSAALDLDRLAARTELGGLLSLLAAVRTGRGDHARWFGSEHEQAVLDDPELARERAEEAADGAEYSGGALAAAPVFDELRSVALIGPAAGALAEALVAARDELAVTIVAAPSELAAISRVHDPHPRVRHEPGSGLHPRPDAHDAVLLAGVLERHADADAAHLLRQAAQSLTGGGSVLVFSEVMDHDLADEHDYEEDLVGFALTGGGLRDRDELAGLFAHAGLDVAERLTFGWGESLYRLQPQRTAG